MPIYEYSCENCRHEFELLIRGPERPVCPHCDSDQLSKVLSVPAAHTARSDLPVCSPSPGNCGLPACQGGMCQFPG